MIEYVEGTPLNQFLQENELTIKEKLALFSTIVKAIQYAHNQQVVHGDIKPENIVVTKEGVAKLIDFGVSRQSKQNNKVIHDYLCALSRGYTSPEQISGKATASVLTDVYALGALLSFIITGSTPFQASENDNRYFWSVEGTYLLCITVK